jgi:parallel beta-helix repeat protein
MSRQERSGKAALPAAGQRACRLLGAAAVLLAWACSPAFGTDYYVSKEIGASNSNPGTEALPWATIQKAATTLVAGDTVYIKAGTYAERVSPAHSGNPGQPIVFRNFAADLVTIDAENGARSQCIQVNNRSYLTFYGLTLTGATGGTGFEVNDGSSYLVLDHLTCTAHRIGIQLTGDVTPVSYLTVQNCTSTNNTHYGIFLDKKVYNSVIGPNNRFAYSGPETSSYGIEITTDYPGVYADGARYITVIGNEVDHNESQGLQTWNAGYVWILNNHWHDNGATGVQIEDGSRNVYIEGNLSENNAQTYEYETGMWVDDSVDVVVQNNTLLSNKIGLMITSTNGCIARYNTIALNNRGVPDTVNAAGIVVNNSSNSITVVHNTLYRNSQSDSQRTGIAFGTNSAITNAVVKNNILSETLSSRDFLVGNAPYSADYNLVYNTRALSIRWLGSSYTWANYLAASGQDAHSLTSNPLFVAAGTDFHLQATSPAVDHGAFLTQTTSGGSGTLVPVADTKYFSAGLGLRLGDVVVIGANLPVTVTAVDAVASTLTIDHGVSWSAGDPVGYPYAGTQPDIGAYEYVPVGTATWTPTVTPVLSPTASPTATPTRTATPIVSPTSTATRTATRTISATFTITRTESPTATPGKTKTPTPTATPSPVPPTPTATETFGAIDSVVAYPNPARDRVRFLIGPGVPGQVRVRIYNLAGEKVAEVDAVRNGSGPLSLVWDCEKAAAGLYLARVEIAGTRRTVVKLAVAH